MEFSYLFILVTSCPPPQLLHILEMPHRIPTPKQRTITEFLYFEEWKPKSFESFLAFELHIKGMSSKEIFLTE